jgi:glycosyltransferase involved in cell wall biosynthesis
MIKVAALTSSTNTPSSCFQVRQHIKPLKQLVIQVKEHIPNINKNKFVPDFATGIKHQKSLKIMMLGVKLISRIPGVAGSWSSQITWVQREFIPGRCTLEAFLKKPLVFDVDDAIWLAYTSDYSNQRSYAERVFNSIQSIAKCTDIIIAGNNYLADWFVNYPAEVRIIPTAIDTEHFRPKLTSSDDNSHKFMIGWTGSAGNLGYLQTIESAIAQFMNQFLDSELLIIADQPLSFSSLPAERVRFIPWSSQTEVTGVQQMDIGLMPLPNNKWTKGKCSFKMLQYMACCIPVIVSPVGMNSEVLALGEVGLGANSPSDWYEALVFFYKNRSLGHNFGKMVVKLLKIISIKKLFVKN